MLSGTAIEVREPRAVSEILLSYQRSVYTGLQQGTIHSFQGLRKST